jgi:predicted AAA+ superfamily ATPase
MNNENLIQRPLPLKKLIAFKDTQLIKVITGIRRCGKSTLFEIYQNWLVDNGVHKDQIISLNMEDPDNRDLLDWTKLYDYIKARLNPNQMNYIFLDEIQAVPEYERTADGLFIKKNVDLYLTGSNAHMLSGELATLLSGRYVEIHIFPLTFKEYISAVQSTDLLQSYRDYARYSAFPYTISMRNDKAHINDYLGGIYNTIILKDVTQRKKIAAPLVLDSLVRYLFDNIGNLLSTTNIANSMKGQKRPTSVHTIENYIGALCDAYIIYHAPRFDIKGKQYLTSGGKYYIADTAFRYHLLGTKNVNPASILENIVYLELLRREKHIFVGKVDTTEVDFVAETPGGQTEYYQVALTLHDKSVFEREIRPLNVIHDHNAKYLLTMDFDPESSYNGIRIVNALDWLAG